MKLGKTTKEKALDQLIFSLSPGTSFWAPHRYRANTEQEERWWGQSMAPNREGGRSYYL